jgi:hypothetical protein
MPQAVYRSAPQRESMMRRRIGWVTATLLLLVLTFAAGWLSAKLRVGSRVDRASLSELERRFADRMTGATLVGQFTITGREDRGAIPDRYEISSVEKVGANEWRFNTRMKYGGIDVSLPVVVPIEWAGDTPMISMSDVTIPSRGTFSVRLLFYGDRYAGWWQHGQVGGYMFGRIEKTAGP